MSDPVEVALIVAAASVVPNILSLLLQFFTHGRITTLERNTNGIKDELVRVTGEAERAKGVIEGKADAEPTPRRTEQT
jgi:hypothetical protein